MEYGWSNNGRQGRDGGGKGKRSAFNLLEVPSNFLAVVAPMVLLTAKSQIVQNCHGGIELLNGVFRVHMLEILENY